MTPELLSPAGGFDAALAAFQYGADAVYLGLPRFSARADADNITPERLRVLLAHARAFPRPKKIYVTFNTLVQDGELTQAIDALDELADLAPDGVIIQDLGVARLIREHFPRLPLHASTQLAAHNLDGIRALRDLGFTRVVLARELTLDEIADIVQNGGVEIEIFIHGALCYSVSGLCLFSSHLAGRSGNRGRCAYCCRETFTQKGIDAPPYPFSMRDLSFAPILDAVVATGAHSFKIEGRMKSPLYVACVTDYYRRKLDRSLTPSTEAALIQDLQTVFSRPWTTLYANEELGIRNQELNTEHGESRHTAPSTPIPSSSLSIPNSSFLTPNSLSASPIDSAAVGHRGARIGQVEAVVRDRTGSRWLRFTTHRALEKHDGLQVEPSGGGAPFGFAVTRLRLAFAHPPSDLRPLISVPADAIVEVALPDDDVPDIPNGSPVFCSASQAVRRRYVIRSIRESELASGHPVAFRVTLQPNGIAVHAAAASIHADAFIPLALSSSRQPEQTASAVRKAFERLGDTAWQLASLTLDDPQTLYAPPSKLNEARRAVLDRLTENWTAARAAHRATIEVGRRVPSPPHSSAQTCGGQGTARPACHVASCALWSFKLRADTPPLPASALAEFDTLVLAIGHAPFKTLEGQLADWSRLIAPSRIRLALPLLTRAPELPALKATIRQLAAADWTRWECADLAGHRMLAEQGIVPHSADWSLYALNRAALAELARLGIRTAVLSPENNRDNLHALCASSDIPEVLAYQHTPLFISETAPDLPLAAPETHLTDRRKRAFTVQQIDGRWITVLDAPFCIADRLAETGATRFRIDLSWSPVSACTSETIAIIRAGRTPLNAHVANFDRGFI